MGMRTFTPLRRWRQCAWFHTSRRMPDISYVVQRPVTPSRSASSRILTLHCEDGQAVLRSPRWNHLITPGYDSRAGRPLPEVGTSPSVLRPAGDPSACPRPSKRSTDDRPDRLLSLPISTRSWVGWLHRREPPRTAPQVALCLDRQRRRAGDRGHPNVGLRGR